MLVLFNAIAGARDDVGGPFELVDQYNRVVTEKDYQGNPALIYFGFATCPEVCPTDLRKISWLADKLESQAGQNMTPIFITLDPERDTPERLNTYLEYFGKDMVGLTGSVEAITEIADSYHVYFKKTFYGDQGDYMIDHSTMLFLVDAQGNYLAHYGRKVEQDDLYDRVILKLKETSS